MKLNSVWIIYKSNSKSAKEEVLACQNSLKAKGIKVITASIGMGLNPFPDDFREYQIRNQKD